ncbi:MAG TPA: hypothetical protein VMI54_00890 [Polyangiaceae bacterium]|nr:hypothetical protein [Polyangiaceae bacterium]
MEDADCTRRLTRARALAGQAPSDLAPLARAALLAQVKATPVVFLERPATAPADPVVRYWRHELLRSELPGRVLARLYHGFRRFPAFLREVLLTDGYLYAETPALGATLAEGVTPGALFREPRIVIERGSAELHAELDALGVYRYVDGPERGKPSRLVLFDRVRAESAPPLAPRHVDLEPLRDTLGFDSMTLERVTSDGVVALAHYGETAVPTLLVRHGAELELACEAPGPARAALDERRQTALGRARALERVRGAVLAAVDESLPFDEPKTEFGQQDGKLRQEWRQAYFRGARHYDFNGDTYAVFDGGGRPFVPEVCIDFIVDSFERAGGAWYAPESAPRAHLAGRIDFDGTGMLNRRNVEEFIALARRRPDWFELRPTPPEEQVPFKWRDRFFATLFQERREYQPGDIVVILGERDDEKLHYHSFFVFDADPVTAMPTLVAGNSGRPRVRAWAAEMASAPKRSIFARVRPRAAFLEQTLEGSARGAPRPLTAKAEPLRSPAP